MDMLLADAQSVAEIAMCGGRIYTLSAVKALTCARNVKNKFLTSSAP